MSSAVPVSALPPAVRPRGRPPAMPAANNVQPPYAHLVQVPMAPVVQQPKFTIARRPRPQQPQQARAPAAAPPASMSAAEMDAYLSSIVEKSLPTSPIADEQREATVARIRAAAAHIWPESEVHVYGSMSNGLQLRQADVDVCLLTHPSRIAMPRDRELAADAVKRLAEQMRNDGGPPLNLEAVTQTRVPVLKFTDPSSGVSYDVTIDNMLGVYNSKLLHAYCALDPRVRPLIVLVKRWAKLRNLNNTRTFTLSSYAWVLMVIFFLQRRGFLPNLQQMHAEGKECTPRMTHGFNTYFFEGDVKSLPPELIVNNGHIVELGANPASLSALFAGFMEYYADNFDYEHYSVCPRLGVPLSRLANGWDEQSAKRHGAETRRLIAERKEAREYGAFEGAEELPFIDGGRFFFCIEDPFDVTHNVGRPISTRTLSRIMNELGAASRKMKMGLPDTIFR